MDIFKLKDESSLLLIAESIHENDMSDEDIVLPKKISPQNEDSAEKEETAQNDLLGQSNSLLKDAQTDSNIGTTPPLKCQDLTLHNQNGEARFEKLVLDQVKVPEKTR